ncbi:class I SAM-dependent methyltransferase [Ectothiorhodospira shaposhnikovii]|uniref:class I SAM-dependent methyltransferase n=1 Tax=Ectothiorhodospira shaposhnikovii TaxID=1054 RepID=UPI001904AC0A|nr:class I SAM-dependent methyltransferase [Ectothiorhodospira shaposhnikovii]
MPSPAVLLVALREVITRQRAPRRTEPDLIMADPEQVAAYTRAGREDGVMAPVYHFHAAQVCDVIRPGDTVLDLACGPATQLALVARLNPDVRFIGVDLSEEMLARAREHIAEQQLDNIEFRHGSIDALDFLEAKSVDAVMSTMALHHLPDEETLSSTFNEISRVLKPDGGLYLVDFGHLKSPRSIEYFANQYADRQPDLFTEDYRNSLWAAFPKEAFQRGHARHLAERSRLYSTFIFPFMVAIKSPSRRADEQALRETFARLREQLPPHHRRDLKDLKTFFGLGGLSSPLL